MILIFIRVCVYVCALPCVHWCPQKPEKATDPLQLVLQVTCNIMRLLTWMFGRELKDSAKSESILKGLVVSPDIRYSIYIHIMAILLYKTILNIHPSSIFFSVCIFRFKSIELKLA